VGNFLTQSTYVSNEPPSQRSDRSHSRSVRGSADTLYNKYNSFSSSCLLSFSS
jgi:hypothetical protein